LTAPAREEFNTSPGVTLGTVAYMSPDQVRGEDLDARSDIFSLGLVLYEMATGVPAFSGNTSGVIHEAILNRVPISPLRLILICRPSWKKSSPRRSKKTLTCAIRALPSFERISSV